MGCFDVVVTIEVMGAGRCEARDGDETESGLACS